MLLTAARYSRLATRYSRLASRGSRLVYSPSFYLHANLSRCFASASDANHAAADPFVKCVIADSPRSVIRAVSNVTRVRLASRARRVILGRCAHDEEILDHLDAHDPPRRYLART